MEIYCVVISGGSIIKMFRLSNSKQMLFNLSKHQFLYFQNGHNTTISFLDIRLKQDNTGKSKDIVRCLENISYYYNCIWTTGRGATLH